MRLQPPVCAFDRRPRRRPRPSGSRYRRGARGTEVVAELVDERVAGGDVEVGDVVVADAVEVLHQRPQAVAMGGDEVVAPARRSGTMPSAQYGSDRTSTSFRHSAIG